MPSLSRDIVYKEPLDMYSNTASLMRTPELGDLNADKMCMSGGVASQAWSKQSTNCEVTPDGREKSSPNASTLEAHGSYTDCSVLTNPSCNHGQSLVLEDSLLRSIAFLKHELVPLREWEDERQQRYEQFLESLGQEEFVLQMKAFLRLFKSSSSIMYRL